MSAPHTLLCAAALCAALAGLPAAGADPLGEARSAGLIGERPDGLLGTVGSPPPPVALLVERVNAERLARYRDIAARNGRPLAEVQALAGSRLTGGVPSGQYVLGSDGRWQRR